MTRHKTDQRAGFTLVELLVGSMIYILVIVLSARGWQSISAEPAAFSQHASGTSELRLAVEHLLQGMGGAVSLEVVSPTEVLIRREQEVSELAGAWTALGDQGLHYFFDGSVLTCIDVASGLTRFVARLEVFDVTEIIAGEVHIYLCTGTAQGQRDTTLVWTP